MSTKCTRDCKECKNDNGIPWCSCDRRDHNPAFSEEFEAYLKKEEEKIMRELDKAGLELLKTKCPCCINESVCRDPERKKANR